MLKCQLFSYIVAVCVLAFTGKGYGQERSVVPYLGASGSADILNFFSGGNAGWGLEAGVDFRPFYAGLEYGVYSVLFEQSLSTDPLAGGDPPSHPVFDASNQFWGIHAGYIIIDKFYLGLVVLYSYEPWEQWDSASVSWVDYTKHFLNVGPDFRYSGIDHGHIYLAFAYTIRRGLKAGLGYMF